MNHKEKCQICGKEHSNSSLIPGAVVRGALIEVIKKKYPKWSNTGYICRSDLDKFKKEYIKNVLELEKGELSKLDHEVIKSLTQHEVIARHTEKEFEHKLTLGERMADRIAAFGGSWAFVTIFMAILIGWIILNSIVLAVKPLDPYPFILLNLILSAVAAFQAPIIMMSQNRVEVKDRLRSENDYKVNLKAELEIRHLHEKIDHLLHTQWQRLLEIQELQLELMQQMGKKK